MNLQIRWLNVIQGISLLEFKLYFSISIYFVSLSIYKRTPDLLLMSITSCFIRLSSDHLSILFIWAPVYLAVYMFISIIVCFSYVCISLPVCLSSWLSMYFKILSTCMSVFLYGILTASLLDSLPCKQYGCLQYMYNKQMSFCLFVKHFCFIIFIFNPLSWKSKVFLV